MDLKVGKEYVRKKSDGTLGAAAVKVVAVTDLYVVYRYDTGNENSTDLDWFKKNYVDYRENSADIVKVYPCMDQNGFVRFVNKYGEAPNFKTKKWDKTSINPGTDAFDKPMYFNTNIWELVL